METLKILIFNWRDIRNPETGGAEAFTHEVAKRWVKTGHEVTLFTSGFRIVSVREDFELNVLEANAFGIPCVAYDVAGLRGSIINERTGVLIKENGDIGKLAEAVIRVLENEVLRKTLSENALEHSKTSTGTRLLKNSRGS